MCDMWYVVCGINSSSSECVLRHYLVEIATFTLHFYSSQLGTYKASLTPT